MRGSDQRLRITTAFSWRFVTPLLAGSALNPINSSLIATALVPIAAALHVSLGRTAVLVSTLYLTTAIAQPTAGKLSEEFGPRRVFLAGIHAVLVGGVVGGLGVDLSALVVARVLIGMGTATAYPSAMLLVRRRAEQAGMDEPPAGVLGGLVLAGTVTVAAGFPLGGVLVDAWGWRTAFLVNIPLAVVAVVLAFRWIPRDPAIAEPVTVRAVATRIDLAGIAGFAVAMAALLVFLMSMPRPDWVALGLAVLVAVFGTASRNAQQHPLPGLTVAAQAQHVLAHGMAAAFGLAAIFNVASLMVIVALIRARKLAPQRAEAREEEPAIASR